MGESGVGMDVEEEKWEKWKDGWMGREVTGGEGGGGRGGGLDDSGIGIGGGLEVCDGCLLKGVGFRVVCKGRMLTWGPFEFFVVVGGS